MSEIVNKVAQSGLVIFDLEEIYPQGELVVLDIKDQLFQGMILKEKDFRAYVSSTDWSIYSGKHVAITCSTDAIVPVWAFMLLSLNISKHAITVVHGTKEDLITFLFHKVFEQVNWHQYREARIVIKGCSKKEVPIAVYVEATNRLLPLSKSLMFGEPCSTVPLYKRPKEGSGSE